jgi:predicted Rossmann fold nucleotide-binding protein DprA/Smf involved in DNA uptake
MIHLAHNDDAFATMLLMSQISANRDELERPLSYAEYYQLRRRVAESPLSRMGNLIDMDVYAMRKALDMTESEAYKLCVLLHRTMPLSYAIERFCNSGIEIATVDETTYPQKLMNNLGEKAPPMVYYSGNMGLTENSAIALIGNSSLKPEVIEFADRMVQAAVKTGLTVVTGGETGFGRAVENEVMERGGTVISFLAESLSEHIHLPNMYDMIIDGKALMLSSVHPEAHYTAPHALMRNKCIYGLANAAFVISCEKGRGSAWDGACSALRNRYTEKIYVWDNPSIPGNRELIERGATAFRDPSELPLEEMKRVWDTPAFEQISMFDM